MPIFTLAASRSYNPLDNPINRIKGTIGATSGSTTVALTGLDPVTVSNIATLKASRLIAINGSGLPMGGTASVASGTSITLVYPYAVSVAAGTANNWLEWTYGDAPNAKQYPISSVINNGAATLDYLDSDGSKATIGFPASTSGQIEVSVMRTLASTTGNLYGYSRGNIN